MADESKSSHPSPDAGQESADAYLQRRSLRRGSAGWLLLTGLGVAYVVSGDYAGWNFGLAEGGFGGLAIATVLMGTMYACLVFSLAELSSILPTAGGGYGFARRALGTWGGFLTGTAILIEYILAPAAIAVFIGGYVESLGLFGVEAGWPVYLVCFALFIGIHLWGVGEALRFSFVVTGIAVAALLVFCFGALTHFDAGSLNDIAVDEQRLRLQLLAAAGSAGHLGGVPLRDVVLPRRRGRTAGGRGDARSRQVDAEGAGVVDRHPGAAGRAHPAARGRSLRFRRRQGRRQPARRGAGGRLRR